MNRDTQNRECDFKVIMYYLPLSDWPPGSRRRSDWHLQSSWNQLDTVQAIRDMQAAELTRTRKKKPELEFLIRITSNE